ncbi:MAG: DUF975 family protein [Ruminococcaceae bacterium]|nr:DUF975 family protein [Oscillospiraceae bacterium]
MLMTIYKRAFNVLLQKPFKLWGISLLAILLSSVLSGLCGVAIPALGIAVSLLISTAMTVIYLRGYRGEAVEVTDLFACFKDWNTIKRVVLGLGWMYLWIFLWSLIPIVGPFIAIVRSYEYRLTPYILVFEPDVPITEAIKLSSKRTHGYKLQMWLADFVYVLMFVGVVIVLALLALIPYLGVLFTIALIFLCIIYVALAPLFGGLVQAAFYEEIAAANARVCPNCGLRVAPEASFCANCGTPMN